MRLERITLECSIYLIQWCIQCELWLWTSYTFKPAKKLNVLNSPGSSLSTAWAIQCIDTNNTIPIVYISHFCVHLLVLFLSWNSGVVWLLTAWLRLLFMPSCQCWYRIWLWLVHQIQCRRQLFSHGELLWYLLQSLFKTCHSLPNTSHQVLCMCLLLVTQFQHYLQMVDTIYMDWWVMQS